MQVICFNVSPKMEWKNRFLHQVLWMAIIGVENNFEKIRKCKILSSIQNEFQHRESCYKNKKLYFEFNSGKSNGERKNTL